MSTQKKSMIRRYIAFGRLLAECRVRAGIVSQAALASQIGASQQTVSRWEAGLSRPRINEFANLAAVLQTNSDALLESAGYTVPKAVVSFAMPFPVDALSPDDFERFSSDFIEALNPGAKVHREGGPGHTQDGIDIVAVLSDGERQTYQCKRHREFGPQKIHDAVAKDTTRADRKFLLLTRTASPDARAAIALHPNWELWDRDDISRKMRQLPLAEQKRIVRIYFAGQELALLGVSPASPWETAQDFFAAFARKEALFNHTWQLVGRDAALETALEATKNPNVGVVLVKGSGGGGKSRVLKAILDQISADLPVLRIRIVSPTMEITKVSLEELGSGNLLLVVDDAHDRDDLQPLFNHAAANPSTVKLLIVARRYGVEHIRAQASSYSFSGDRLREIDLLPLSKEDSESLARQVLEHLGGPVELAADIARLTHDCPLATVVGAQVVVQERIHPEFVRSEERFRTTLFGRFEKVIAGHLADRENPRDLQKLLGFLALVQPISIEDQWLLAAFEAVDKVSIPDTKRLLRLLIDAGVLFKRGAKYRLSPDVLGDYLVESRFEGPDGRSNGLAEQYFDVLPAAYIENLLLNVGRIDWRRAGVATSDGGPLLDGVWAKLKPSQEYRDPHIKAVQAVAYYQPKRALTFVEELIRKGQFQKQLAEIAKYAAYNLQFTHRALECLWELGRNDGRETNSETAHPIRILTDFAEPQPGKSFEFLGKVIDFGLDLSKRADAWNGRFSPLDFLDGALATEGHSSSYSGHSISMTPFFIDPESVRPMREKVIDLVVGLLADKDTRKAARAAESLSNALCHPIGLLGAHATPDLHDRWTVEFEVTLNKILAAMSTTEIAPLVQVKISSAVNWQAKFGKLPLSAIAAKIQDLVSNDLDVRFTRALVDGYGMEDRLGDREDHHERWENFLDTLVSDLTAKVSDAAARVAFVEDRLQALVTSKRGRSTTVEVPVLRLIDKSPGFAEALADGALLASNCEVHRFSGYALGKVFRDDRAAGRARIAAFIENGRDDLLAAVGNAYQNQKFEQGWVTSEDLRNISTLLGSSSEWVVLTAVRALRFLAEWNHDLALGLVRIASIPTARVADEIATLFEFGAKLQIGALSKDDVESLLGRIETLPELDGYWLDKFLAHLSESHPWECARFFMRRVEAADNGHMRPCNYGPWVHERLRFRKSPEGTSVMKEVAQWMLRNFDQRGMFSYHSRNLFEAMFGPFDAEIVAFFEEWLAASTADDLTVLATIVREADQDFVFLQSPFVADLLERARQEGPETYRMVGSELYCSAVSGMRQGTPGQPFPEDLALQRKTEEMLAKTPRFSAAYELYESLHQYANSAIRRAVIEDDED